MPESINISMDVIYLSTLDSKKWDYLNLARARNLQTIAFVRTNSHTDTYASGQKVDKLWNQMAAILEEHVDGMQPSLISTPNQ